MAAHIHDFVTTWENLSDVIERVETSDSCVVDLFKWDRGANFAT